MGTIGGNIANGSPIGDTPPPLIALGATLVLRKGKAAATIPLEEFFIAYGKQDRRPGEFVEAVQVPLPPKERSFRRLQGHQAPRRGHYLDAGAFHLELETDGTVWSRSASPMAAWRRRRSARLQLRRRFSAKSGRWKRSRLALSAYEQDFTPLSDMRASADYRALVAKNLLMRFFLETPERQNRSR
jgi:xanthine dehydrogenase small subunit